MTCSASVRTPASSTSYPRCRLAAWSDTPGKNKALTVVANLTRHAPEPRDAKRAAAMSFAPVTGPMGLPAECSPSSRKAMRRTFKTRSRWVGSDFQQAKNRRQSSQFLQIVAKPEPAARAKAKPEPKLTRVAFKVSRLMEFCSERELQNQTGHSVYDWPLVVLKELMDNALDACEEAEVAPGHLGHRRYRNRSSIQDNARRHRRRDHQVDPRLHDPGLQPRGLCLADPRRAGQCAQDHSRHGLCARSRARQRRPTRPG